LLFGKYFFIFDYKIIISQPHNRVKFTKMPLHENQFFKIFSESSLRGHLERSPAEISLRDFAYAKFRLRAAHYAQNDSVRAKSKRVSQTAKSFGSRGGKNKFCVFLGGSGANRPTLN
jgi:hypothetical protein